MILETISKTQSFDFTGENIKFEIHCDNEGCCIRAEAFGDSYTECLQRWNTRTERASIIADATDYVDNCEAEGLTGPDKIDAMRCVIEFLKDR